MHVHGEEMGTGSHQDVPTDLSLWPQIPCPVPAFWGSPLRTCPTCHLPRSGVTGRPPKRLLEGAQGWNCLTGSLGAPGAVGACSFGEAPALPTPSRCPWLCLISLALHGPSGFQELNSHLCSSCYVPCWSKHFTSINSVEPLDSSVR